VLFRHPHFAGVEEIERFLHSIAHLAAGGRADRLPLFKGGLDNWAKLGNVGHAKSSGKIAPPF
jgi:hypothetical protein